MHNPAFIATYERRLVELGFPVAQIQRQVREIADHHEDLELAAREEGLSEADAAARADELLGEPSALAENAVRMLRQSSWWWRHRLIGFCLLPPLAIMVLIAAGLIAGYLVGKFILPAEQAAAMADGRSGFGLLEAGVGGVYCAALACTSLLFCRLALRSASGMTWAAIACMVCALHGLFGFVGIKPHSVFVGFVSIPVWPQALAATIPLLVAAAAFARRRRIKRQLAAHASGAEGLDWVRRAAVLLLLAPALSLTGCASPKEKPVCTRGWIGGECSLVKQETSLRRAFPAAGTVYDPAFDKSVGHAQKAAIKITALGTNTPARLAGLREGDVILELNHQPVTRLQDFRQTIDQSEPGTVLPVKASRNGWTLEFGVLVGRETYRREGMLRIALPSIVEPWDLWPNPGFSLVFLGCRTNPGMRHELGGWREVSEDSWKAWLVLFEVASYKRILSQACASALPVPAHAPELQTNPAPR